MPFLESHFGVWQNSGSRPKLGKLTSTRKKEPEEECRLELGGGWGVGGVAWSSYLSESPAESGRPLPLTKMASPRRQRTVEYGGASGPVALNEDGGSGEAAAGRGSGGQFCRQRAAGGVPSSSNGRE